MLILASYGIPPNMLKAINVTYSGRKARVLTPDGTSDEFKLLAGALQGDTLAPFLFFIVLDYAPRIATNNYEDLGFAFELRRSRIEAEKMLDLDFADEIALLSDQKPGAQDLLRKVETECGKTGLHLNDKKTVHVVEYQHTGPTIGMHGVTN
jgi:hypothetical protein